MEMWACGPLGQYADFICVCVDDKSVALSFERMFKFTKAINGVVLRRQDMPTFGQLGCSGFIVIGADGLCKSKKTNAFLDYGEKAFKNAESVIQIALEDAPHIVAPPKNTLKEDERQHMYANGQTLRLEGISSDTTLNGCVVTVVKFDTTKGRFIVLLSDGTDRQLAVRPCCLAPLGETETTAATNSAAAAGLQDYVAPKLVGCDVVDKEHADCTAAINACIKSRTRESLTALLACLEHHFAHEEQLATLSGFGNTSDSFSPMFGHAKDHARILNLARAELERTTAPQSSSAVSLETIQVLAAAFFEHANVFDSLLEGNLSSQ
jgi:hemerythrin